MIMLDNIYKEFQSEVVAAYGDELDMGKGTLPVVVYYIFQWIADPEKRVNVVERCRKVMEGIIEKEGGTEISALRELLSGDVSLDDGIEKGIEG